LLYVYAYPKYFQLTLLALTSSSYYYIVIINFVQLICHKEKNKKAPKTVPVKRINNAINVYRSSSNYRQVQ